MEENIEEIEVEDEEKTKAEKLRIIEILAESLLKKRDEAVEGRAASGVERRWLEDEEAFDGLDATNRSSSMLDYATGESYHKTDKGPKRSSVIVNIIRGRCETAEGRFSDIQLPVDDRNWGLQITPVPELVKGMTNESPAVDENRQEILKPDGSKVTISDVARREIEEAKKKMRAMETEIDDQLNECSYNGENRKCVKNAVRLGTGILKGPNVVKQIRKTWMPQSEGDTTVHVLEAVEEHKPASKSVDPWNVYPDPNCGEDIKRAAYIWEYDRILPRELRSLIGVDGYLTDQIFKVLQEDPIRTKVVESKKGLKIQQDTAARGATYERWEYHGDINKEDLEALGCDCEEKTGDSLSACVVFGNDRPIKVILNTLDTGDMPYDFFQWTAVTGSPWGIGIPRMMIWQQRIITAAWRAMMDNAGDSAGANVVLGFGIEPDDGKWELTGKKIWKAIGDIEDVRNAFAQFQVANNQVELQNIIELALRFIDMETSLPMLFQGEKGELPETLGATNIMVDSNNVALRSRVKAWDDQITRPHITRYYHWNMQYNEKTDIKGDYNVDARGTSVLLAKDQQAEALTEVLQLRNDPMISDVVDWKKAIKQLFSARRLDVVLSDDDIAKNEKKRAEQPVVDPSIQGNIDVATIRAEGEMQKAELIRQTELQKIELQRDIKIAEMEAQSQQDELRRQHEIALAQMTYNTKIMEMSEKTGISLEKIKSDLARDAAKISLQRELSTEKGKAEQVVTPVSEPPQRAKPGRAFQE